MLFGFKFYFVTGAALTIQTLTTILSVWLFVDFYNGDDMEIGKRIGTFVFSVLFGYLALAAHALGIIYKKGFGYRVESSMDAEVLSKMTRTERRKHLRKMSNKK